jgi:hypothetical protein
MGTSQLPFWAWIRAGVSGPSDRCRHPAITFPNHTLARYPTLPALSSLMLSLENGVIERAPVQPKWGVPMANTDVEKNSAIHANEKHAPAKYLLYIDILGFSNLVRERGAVGRLYKTIDSLNVHRHHAFRTIAFSDTLLVYNITNPETKDDCHYFIMYLCEFAQDLFYRLVGRDIHFRGYLTLGDFIVADFKNLNAFYGGALIEAYEREKQIESTGLFIDNNILGDCDIFHFEKYDERCSYVYLMQSLDTITFPDDSGYPVDPILVFAQDGEWSLHMILST